MLTKYSDRLSLPEAIVKILYTESVISKETLDEVNRLGGVLGDGPLRALCTTVCENPYKLKVFASVLLKSEQTVSIAKDILKEYGKINDTYVYIIINSFYRSSISFANQPPAYLPI